MHRTDDAVIRNRPREISDHLSNVVQGCEIPQPSRSPTLHVEVSRNVDVRVLVVECGGSSALALIGWIRRVGATGLWERPASETDIAGGRSPGSPVPGSGMESTTPQTLCGSLQSSRTVSPRRKFRHRGP